jgi:hypothetical protein
MTITTTTIIRSMGYNISFPSFKNEERVPYEYYLMVLRSSDYDLEEIRAIFMKNVNERRFKHIKDMELKWKKNHCPSK